MEGEKIKGVNQRHNYYLINVVYKGLTSLSLSLSLCVCVTLCISVCLYLCLSLAQSPNSVCNDIKLEVRCLITTIATSACCLLLAQ